MAKDTQQSIGRKITLVVLSAVVASVMSATSFFLWRQTSDALQIREAQVTATAYVFASVISEHVKNNDRTQTLIALRAIGKMPSVPYAVVSKADGTVLAVLGTAIILSHKKTAVIKAETEQIKEQGKNKQSGKKLQTKSVFSLINSTTLPVSVPVINGGQKVGTLLMLTDVSDLRQRLIDGFFMAAVAVVFAGLLGMLIASRMKRRITQPIKGLASAMTQVRKTHDFSTRVDRQSNDETGQLVDAFNDMLAHISDRDEKLAHHRETLEQTVEERTRELSVAKTHAEQANMAKSDFLATMSHEIRTPMNGVMVMAELLAGANLMPRQQRYAEVIVRSGQSLLTIINDILDLSKIEAGKLDLEQVPISPAGIIDDVISLFWQKASSKNVDIASFVGSDVPEKISGDPVRLNQILSNLVNNALKFTETGYVAISVRVVPDETLTGKQMKLEFSVTDTGIGIAKNKLASVFQEFTQADQTTTRKFGGTGLGLSICKKIVAAMDGFVDVESVENRGSRFFFEIPVQVVQVADLVIDGSNSQLKKAGVFVDGFASKRSFGSYLNAAGVNVKLLEREELVDVHTMGLDAVFVCSGAVKFIPDRLDGVTKPTMIAVSQLGESNAEDLIRTGRVDDLIMRPVGRNDMLAMIERLSIDAPRGLEAISMATKGRAKLPQFNGAKVLVADDNAVNREVIIEVLRQLGIQPDVANDGLEAVNAWKGEPFDLVFMDCSMPVLDGYAATTQIRELEKSSGRARTPVIALTAHIAGDDSEKWQNAGMDDFITKPFTIKTIAERMGMFLTEVEAIDEVEAETAPNLAPVITTQITPVIEPQVAPETAPLVVSATAPHVAPVATTTPQLQVTETQTVAVEEAVATPEHVVIEAPLVETNELPILSQTVMDDLTDSGGGSTDLLFRVFDLFEDNAPQALKDIETSSCQSDLLALADAAHGLKSMSANIGAKQVAAACGELELAARLEKEIDMGASLQKISQSLSTALNEIKAFKAA